MDAVNAQQLSRSLQDDFDAAIVEQARAQPPQVTESDGPAGWRPATPTIGSVWMNLGSVSVVSASRVIVAVFTWKPIRDERFCIAWDMTDTPLLDRITSSRCLEDFELTLSNPDWYSSTLRTGTGSLRFLPTTSRAFA